MEFYPILNFVISYYKISITPLFMRGFKSVQKMPNLVYVSSKHTAQQHTLIPSFPLTACRLPHGLTFQNLVSERIRRKVYDHDHSTQNLLYRQS